MDLEAQAEVTDACLCLEPAFQLFRRVRGAIIQNEGHVLDPAPECFRNDHLRHKGLEIDKTLPLATGSVDLAISDGKPGKQVACAATMVAGFVQYRLALARWTRRLLAFAGLKGGFFIQTDQPKAVLQERLRLEIRVEDGTGTL